MTGTWLNRRVLLQGVAAAVGSLAMAGPVMGRPLQPLAAGVRPLSGSLVAWIALRDRQAAIRLAHFDTQGVWRGQTPDTSVAAASVRAAFDQAGALARETAARSWGVAADDCTMLPHRIVHAASGRSVGYAVWTDFA